MHDGAPPARPQDPAAGAETWLVRHRGFLLLLLLVAVLYGWGIGSYGLWDPWEPKYARAVHEMREQGEWITPYLNDKIRWTKPILIYWAMLVPTALFGETEAAFRLPSVLGALLGMWAVYYAVGRLRSRRTGLLAAAILATLPQYFYLARQATPDMLLTGFLTVSLCLFALARFRPERRDLHLGVAYAALGLAFLTKGPVACAIVLWTAILCALPDIVPRRLLSARALVADLLGLVREYRVLRGVAIFAAVAGPWYLAMLWRHGDLFVENFIVDENLNRFSAAAFVGHVGIASRYMSTLIHGTFPWIGLLPVAALLLVPTRDPFDDDARMRWYCAAWCLAVLSIFTMASTKIDHYVLPMMPGVAITLALFLERAIERPSGLTRAAWILSPVLLLLPVKDFMVDQYRWVFASFVPQQWIYEPAELVDRGIWLVFAAWIVVAVWGFLARSARGGVVIAAFAVAFLHAGLMVDVVLPAHSPERNLRHYAERYDELREPDAELVFYGWIRYSIRYYHGTDYLYFEEPDLDDLLALVHERPHVYIIAQREYLEPLLAGLERETSTRWTAVAEDHPLFLLLRPVPAGIPGQG